MTKEKFVHCWNFSLSLFFFYILIFDFCNSFHIVHNVIILQVVLSSEGGSSSCADIMEDGENKDGDCLGSEVMG